MDEIERKKTIELLKEMRHGDGKTLENKTQCEGRLTWMYKGTCDQVDREEYLLGKTIDKSFRNGESSEVIGRNFELSNVPKRLLSKPESTEQVDVAKKILEDPLYKIQQKELEARRKLLDNPVKLRQIQKMIRERNLQRVHRKEEKKKRKHKINKLDEEILDKFILKKLKKFEEADRKKILEEYGQTLNVLSSKREKQLSLSKHCEKGSKKIQNKGYSSGSERMKEILRAQQKRKKKRRKRSRISSGSCSSEEESQSSESSYCGGDSSFSTASSYSSDHRKKCSTFEEQKKNESAKTEVRNIKDTGQKEFRKKSIVLEEITKRTDKRSQIQRSLLVSKNEGREKDIVRQHQTEYNIYSSKSDCEKRKRDENRELKGDSKSSCITKRQRNRYENKCEKSHFSASQPKPLSEKERETILNEMIENAKLRKTDREKNLAKHRKTQSEENNLDDYDDGFMRRQISQATSRGTVADRIRSNVNNIQRFKSDMDRSFIKK